MESQAFPCREMRHGILHDLQPQIGHIAGRNRNILKERRVNTMQRTAQFLHAYTVTVEPGRSNNKEFLRKL